MKGDLEDMINGKICLVTGGTNGIGKATAHALAQMGVVVIIVGRDAQKLARVTEEIKEASGNQHVDSQLADLYSQEEILHLEAEFIYPPEGIFEMTSSTRNLQKYC
jgi:citronellol/citronellal dehydrogenase